jgi:hypothetical protein
MEVEMNIKGIHKICVFGVTLILSVNALPNESDDTSETLFKSKCSRCHGLDKITQTEKTPGQWSFTVNRMREKDVNWISEEEAQNISTYLASHFAGKNSDQNNHSDQPIVPSFLPELMGLITFCLLLITVVIGFVMTHGKRKLFKTHKIFAYITLTSGVIHGILIFITH